jgi:hypothetical protein
MMPKDAERALAHLAQGHRLRLAPVMGGPSAGTWHAFGRDQVNTARWLVVDTKGIHDDAITWLRDRGLVAMLPDPDHKRVDRLQLTAEGQRVAATQLPLF